MKFFKALLVFSLCSLSIFGQKNLSISGTLIDNNTKEPVDMATVSILNTRDKSFVAGSMSNKKGVFNVQGISKGQYIISITYVGYKTINQPVTLSGDNPATNVGKISLVTDDIVLAETVIEGKVPEVVVKGDTVEYDADSYKTPQNAAVEDLLKKLPGAEVDKDGNITVNGKGIKKILVDGKEFFSDDPKVASKNLPAEMVKKVQVLDRKSDMARMTGFDDGDEETVINLTVKEGMKKGTMGNAMAGLGHDVPEGGDLRYEAGAMVNQMRDHDRYTLMLGANNTNNMGAADLGAQRFGGMRGMRRGSGGINDSKNFAFGMNKEFSPKLSLNGDVSYNTSDRNSFSKVETETFLKNDSSLIDRQITKNEDISDNFGLNMRMEWKPDSMNTFIFRPNISYNKSESYETQDFEGFDALYGLQTDTVYRGFANSTNNGEGFNVGGSIEYAHKFSKPGRVFSVSFTGSYNESYSQGNSYWKKYIYEQNILNRDSVVNQRSENDNQTATYRIYTSYVEPIGHNNFLQFAYRYNRYNTESINSTYDLRHSTDFLLPQDTATLNGNQSRSTSRYATEQRFSLKFKSVREKYNYTIGLNVDPSKSTNKTLQPYNSEFTTLILPFPYDKRLPNVMGDSIIPGGLLEQNVINLSPELNFNYLFGKRTNLRIDYSGNTSQPTSKQLADYEDHSNPMNTVKGNPNLKPSYSNQLSARFSKFVPESQFFYNIDARGNLSFNDIVTVTTINTDRTKYTTYSNVNGNWNARLRGMFNTPLKNKKFTVGDFAMVSYDNSKGYTNGSLNTTKNLSVTNRANANYRSELFDVGLNGSLTYQNVVNELQSENSRETYDWGIGGYTAWYLPYKFTLDSDIDLILRRGYSEGFNTNQVIWNAALAKEIFNKKFGTGILKFKIYDILQERKSMSYTVGNGYTRNTESTTLPSFFMCSFIYKFQIFPGGNASAKDMEPDYGGRGGRFRGPDGGGRPF